MKGNVLDMANGEAKQISKYNFYHQPDTSSNINLSGLSKMQLTALSTFIYNNLHGQVLTLV